MAKADMHRQIHAIIETHKAQSKEEVKDWDEWRSWYNGDYHSKAKVESTLSDFSGGTADSIQMETNYAYAFMDTMTSNICPTNPQTTVASRREALKEAAAVREALVNDRFRYLRLFRKLWSATISAGICGHSFVKTTWDEQRASVRYTAKDPRNVWFDRNAEEWKDIRYLIEATVITEEEFKHRVKAKKYKPSAKKLAEFNAYPTWLKDTQNSKTMIKDAAQEAFKWIVVYEFYDFRGKGRYYNFIDGCDVPIFEGELPYQFVRNPYSYLVFNDNQKDLAGTSDIKLIAPLLDRLNELDSLQLEHAHYSIPAIIVNTAAVDNGAAITRALQSVGGAGGLIEAHMRTGMTGAGMKDLFWNTPTPGLNPDFAVMRDRLISVIEFILAMPQYSRGGTGGADLATEVNLADTALQTRNGKRVRALDDVIVGVAEHTSGLYEEFLGKDNALPIRLTDSEEIQRVTRETMGARPVNEGPIEYDFTIVPYSPTENHRLVQLHSLQTNMEFLANNPAVDQKKLMSKLLELMMMDDLLQEGAPAQEVGNQLQMGAMGGPGQPGPPPQDPLAAGGQPLGMEPPPSPMPLGGPGTDGNAINVNPLGALGE